jgi:hypothetical protein
MDFRAGCTMELVFHDAERIVAHAPLLSLSNLLGVQICKPRAAIGAEEADA